MRIMRDRLNSKCGNSCKPCQELIQFKVMLLECKVCAYVRVCTHVYVCTHVFVCVHALPVKAWSVPKTFC